VELGVEQGEGAAHDQVYPRSFLGGFLERSQDGGIGEMIELEDDLPLFVGLSLDGLEEGFADGRTCLLYTAEAADE